MHQPFFVTGARGQLGGEICRQLGDRARGSDIDTLDLCDAHAVEMTLVGMRPSAVIHCAAYTAVDKAETDEALCRLVNAGTVRTLARLCREMEIPLVQVSTDYVFGGPSIGRPWREDDPVSPQGVYARTKLEGERAAAECPKHLVVRTCGLYAWPGDPAAKNFVRTMLRLAGEGRALKIVNDQQCTPSYVPHVARAIVALLRLAEDGDAAWGTYHLTNTGEVTWFQFAAEIFRLAGLAPKVEPISTAQFAAPAARPSYSVLDTARYHALAAPRMPDWRAALAEYFTELAAVRSV